MSRASGMCGREEKCIQGLVAKPEVHRPLGRPRHKWEDNVKLDFKGTIQPLRQSFL
jgi:hypothetical protein